MSESTIALFNSATKSSVANYMKEHDLGPLLCDYNEQSSELLLCPALRGGFRQAFLSRLIATMNELTGSPNMLEHVRKLFGTLVRNESWLELSGISPKGSHQPDEMQFVFELNFDSNLFRFFFHIDQRRRKIFLRKVSELNWNYFELFSEPLPTAKFHQNQSKSQVKGPNSTGLTLSVPTSRMMGHTSFGSQQSHSLTSTPTSVQNVDDELLLDLLLQHIGIASSQQREEMSVSVRHESHDRQQYHQQQQDLSNSEPLESQHQHKEREPIGESWNKIQEISFSAHLLVFFELNTMEISTTYKLLDFVESECHGCLRLGASETFEEALFSQFPQFDKSNNFADLIHFVTEGLLYFSSCN